MKEGRRPEESSNGRLLGSYEKKRDLSADCSMPAVGGRREFERRAGQMDGNFCTPDCGRLLYLEGISRKQTKSVWLFRGSCFGEKLRWA